jgi:hypothetical protein
MIRQTFKLLGINFAVFLGLVLLLEAAAQVVCLVLPSYDVLFLQPDRIVGWKQVPNLRWTWAGHHWYAAEFAVNVETNSIGFRDTSRPVAKKQDVRRIAILGDSFIEAVQVPFDKTSAQMLQRMLNSRDPQFETWESLNFGISNYGIGQYLLAWEQYARQFDPEYVTIFVAKFHMLRTVSKYEYGAFSKSAKKELWVRPTFRMEAGNLIREPARDFDEFIELQNDLNQSDFSGSRSRSRKTLITPLYAKKLWSHLTQRVNIDRVASAVVPEIDKNANIRLFEVNSSIIRELGRSVVKSGARLIVIDASRYFGDDESVSDLLENLCLKEGLGYIPLYRHLLEAHSRGVSTKWRHDAHFNVTGNEILARSVYDWILLDRNARHGDTAPAGSASVRR